MRKHKQWKGNTQSAFLQEIELTDRYKFWMEECSKAFGQRLDICTVDVLVATNDEEYIIEFNGCASGFCEKDKDNITLRDYIIQYLNNYFIDGKKEYFNSNNCYPNNDDLIRDIKDIDKYDMNKYLEESVENNDDEKSDTEDVDKSS